MDLYSTLVVMVSVLLGIGIIIGLISSIYLMKTLPSTKASQLSILICGIFIFIFFFLPIVTLVDFLVGLFYVSTNLKKSQIKPFQTIFKYLCVIFDWMTNIYFLSFLIINQYIMKGFYHNYCLKITKLFLILLGVLVILGIIIGLLIATFTLDKLLDIYGSYFSMIRNIMNIRKMFLIYLEIGFFISDICKRKNIMCGDNFISYNFWVLGVLKKKN